MSADGTRWRQPIEGAGITRADVLGRRHTIRRAVRDYLDGEGFIEFDSPLLVRGATPDPAVESFAVGDRYLVASTEYQMKRLAIGGFDRLYSLTQNFRPGDIGPVRNPEFTMVEWGRVGAKLSEIEADAEAFVMLALDQLGLSTTIQYARRAIDMKPPWDRMSVAEAITKCTGAPFGRFDLANCRRAVEAAGIALQTEWAEDRDFLFSLLMTHIQPMLGQDRPVFLREWPFYETTTARAGEDGHTADRSELFIAGIELADGFAALADAEIQAALFAGALERRAANGQQPVELDQKYLEAMRDHPPFGAGMAMGFDRLVMLLTNQSHIRNVLAFEWDEL